MRLVKDAADMLTVMLILFLIELATRGITTPLKSALLFMGAFLLAIGLCALIGILARRYEIKSLGMIFRLGFYVALGAFVVWFGRGSMKALQSLVIVAGIVLYLKLSTKDPMEEGE